MIFIICFLYFNNNNNVYKLYNFQISLTGEFFKMLMALTKVTTIDDNTRELVNDALETAVKFGLIQPISD